MSRVKESGTTKEEENGSYLGKGIPQGRAVMEAIPAAPRLQPKALPFATWTLKALQNPECAGLREDTLLQVPRQGAVPKLLKSQMQKGQDFIIVSIIYQIYTY